MGWTTRLTRYPRIVKAYFDPEIKLIWIPNWKRKELNAKVPEKSMRPGFQFWCWDYPGSWSMLFSRLGLARLIADGKIKTWRQKQVEWHGEQQGILMDKALQDAATDVAAQEKALSSAKELSGDSTSPVDTLKSSDGVSQSPSLEKKD